MDDVSAYVRDHWSTEGAEVMSAGKSSLTVNLPYEFRQIDDALDELSELHDVSTDLLLTETGATLRIRSGRAGLRANRHANAAEQTTSHSTHGATALMPFFCKPTYMLLLVLGALAAVFVYLTLLSGSPAPSPPP